ncbi:hypothetical protein HAX54_009892 [Datura stramonium]|uniref:Uncharacterized protein n=1 Tax=Datura stramonium TaxID=4076 RepID=A0ABS8RZZ1_DATST|nr:hypothetical protein [Datura stramonium]
MVSSLAIYLLVQLLYFGLLNVIGERTINILKHLSPVPKPDTKHVIAFANQSDHISFRFATEGSNLEQH